MPMIVARLVDKGSPKARIPISECAIATQRIESLA
jgi:hypothetical protein